jgi:type II secretory pathway pseudopilin PulG
MGTIDKSKIKNQKSKIDFIRKKSFTLIEMIVVIATIGLVLPAVFAIVFTILQQQIKIQRLSIVKREGDYALSVMENTIRNYAKSIHSGIPDETNEICKSVNSTPQSFDYFRDKYNNYFRFCRSRNGTDCDGDGNFIASNSSILINNPSYFIALNSEKTKITNFSIQCYRTNLYSPPVVNVSFTIEYNTTSTRPEERVTSLNYKTKIKLKSY